MSRLQAYLVDFDGTLADTALANYLAYAGALEEAGIWLSREEFEQEAFGRNWRDFLPQLLQKRGSNADPAAIAARKVSLYQGTVGKIRFNEALVALLENRASGTKAALVTSASAANVRAALASREALAHLFDVLITGDDVTRHKPDPQGYRLAAQRLGVFPENCLVFEDSDIGMMAGVAFGAPVLRILL
ncbi:MAG: HAD family phosphatase [Pseudomonadota bacterium]|nr:HAD family phosphatase [Pseudomonadota bacterium]